MLSVGSFNQSAKSNVLLLHVNIKLVTITQQLYRLMLPKQVSIKMTKNISANDIERLKSHVIYMHLENLTTNDHFGNKNFLQNLAKLLTHYI